MSASVASVWRLTCSRAVEKDVGFEISGCTGQTCGCQVRVSKARLGFPSEECGVIRADCTAAYHHHHHGTRAHADRDKAPQNQDIDADTDTDTRTGAPARAHTTDGAVTTVSQNACVTEAQVHMCR